MKRRQWRAVLANEAAAMVAARAAGASWRTIARDFGRPQATVRLTVARSELPVSTGRIVAERLQRRATNSLRCTSSTAMHTEKRDADSGVIRGESIDSESIT